MQKTVLYILLILPLFGLSQSSDNAFIPKYSTVLDSSKGNIFKNLCSRKGLPDNVVFFNLKNEDIDVLKRNLKKITLIESGTNKLKVTSTFYKKFAFQYIGMLMNGNRFIYVNAFYADSEEYLKLYGDWKLEPVYGCDGGVSFWGILFSLNDLKFSQLEFNGP